MYIVTLNGQIVKSILIQSLVLTAMTGCELTILPRDISILHIPQAMSLVFLRHMTIVVNPIHTIWEALLLGIITRREMDISILAKARILEKHGSPILLRQLWQKVLVPRPKVLPSILCITMYSMNIQLRITGEPISMVVSSTSLFPVLRILPIIAIAFQRLSV